MVDAGTNNTYREIMLEEGSQMTVLYNSAHKAISCNAAACKYFGFDNEELLCQGFSARFAECIPKHQPDGQLTYTLDEVIDLAVELGEVRFEAEILKNGLKHLVMIEFHRTLRGDNCFIVLNMVDISNLRQFARNQAATSKDIEVQSAVTQSELYKKEALWLTSILDSIPVPISVTDKNMRWTFVNKAVEDMLGFKRSQVIGKHCSEWGSSICGTKQCGIACLHRGHNSTLFSQFGKDFQVVVNYLYDEDGEICGHIEAVRDISDLMKKNREADEMAHWYKSILDAVPFPISVTDPDMNWTFVNHATETTLGLERGKLAGKSCSNWNADICKTENCGIELFKRGITSTMFSQNDLDFKVEVAALKDSEGQPNGYVEVVQDITKINELSKSVALQLSKMKLMAKAAKIAQWEIDISPETRENSGEPDSKVIYSDEYRNMLGYEQADEFPNLLKSSVDIIHPDDKSRVIEALDSHIQDRTGEIFYDVEYRMQKKNGEYTWYREFAECTRDNQGYATYLVGALMDITENRALIEEAERQREEAEAASKAKSSFLSTMSHEIRTPMNAILGITEIQLQNEELSVDVREALEKVYTSGDMLLGIINDILDLSKIEADKLELLNEKYEVASLISDTAQLNMMRIGSKPIEFELYVDENLPAYISGDELRVKQILNNLLSNAFKYTKLGTVTMSVRSEECANKDEATLVVDVKDTGQGMSKDQVDKLFDEYSRFNMSANRTTEGTGLGMSITRKLIQMMNGKISVESEPGKGSTFTVHLPQNRVSADVLGKELAENLHHFRTRSRAQMKRAQVNRDPMPYGSVLIVDDVETNIYVAKGLMAPYKLQTDSASSGFYAIEKIKSGKKYDIVFMDHMMPEMDGIETTHKLREMGYERPIVALTANAVAGQADVFLGNGFDDFISKPIDVRQLNKILNKLVRDKHPLEVVEAARQVSGAKNQQDEAIPEKTGIDPQFAQIFIRDALKSLAVLKEILGKGSPYSKDDLRTYVIHVHGLKSALANVGKKDLSAVALKLEQSGRDENMDVIESETPQFLRNLMAFVEEITPEEEQGEEIAASEEDTEFLHEKLRAIKEACDEFDDSLVEAALGELQSKPWSPKTKTLLSSISEYLLHSDFDEIIQTVDAVL